MYFLTLLFSIRNIRILIPNEGFVSVERFSKKSKVIGHDIGYVLACFNRDEFILYNKLDISPPNCLGHLGRSL